MNEQNNIIRPEIGVKWIRSQSGSTYLCPAGAADNMESMSDADLRSLCLDESENPHNS